LGDLQLPNRILMAPLTRCRAIDRRIPNDLMRDYYAQRASAGLIMTEATSVVPMGVGYPHTPGIWSEEQGFTFPVLSDFWPHGAVARMYGVFNEQLGCAERATFVIDKQGTVVERFEAPDFDSERDTSAYRAALAKLD